MNWAKLLDARIPRKPVVTYACGFCKAPQPQPGDRHQIGDAYINGERWDKWCDGTETP